MGMFISVLEAFGGGSGMPEASLGPGGGNFGLGAILHSGVLSAMSLGQALSGGGGGFGDAFTVVGRIGQVGGGIFTGGPSTALGGGPVVTWTSRAGGGSFALGADPCPFCCSCKLRADSWQDSFQDSRCSCKLRTDSWQDPVQDSRSFLLSS